MQSCRRAAPAIRIVTSTPASKRRLAHVQPAPGLSDTVIGMRLALVPSLSTPCTRLGNSHTTVFFFFLVDEYYYYY